MKFKTSIALSTAILEDIDRVIGTSGSRSELIEKAVHQYIQALTRAERDRTDLEILNQSASRMRAEATDVLGYQIKL